jgi:hypothetical protein
MIVGFRVCHKLNFWATFDVTNVFDKLHEQLMTFNNSKFCVEIWEPNRTITHTHTQ